MTKTLTTEKNLTPKPSRDSFVARISLTKAEGFALADAATRGHDEVTYREALGAVTTAFETAVKDSYVDITFDQRAELIVALDAYRFLSTTSESEMRFAKKIAKKLDDVERQYVAAVLAWVEAIESARAYVATGGKTDFTVKWIVDSNNRGFELAAFETKDLLARDAAIAEAEAKGEKPARWLTTVYPAFSVAVRPEPTLGDDDSFSYRYGVGVQVIWDTSPRFETESEAKTYAGELIVTMIDKVQSRGAARAAALLAELHELAADIEATPALAVA